MASLASRHDLVCFFLICYQKFRARKLVTNIAELQERITHKFQTLLPICYWILKKMLFSKCIVVKKWTESSLSTVWRRIPKKWFPYYNRFFSQHPNTLWKYQHDHYSYSRIINNLHTHVTYNPDKFTQYILLII